MLYKHMSIAKKENYIVNEHDLRQELYEQALDDLEVNIYEYFDETGPFELSKMLDVFKVAIYGSVEDVINAFEQIWGDAIVQVDEKTDIV